MFYLIISKYFKSYLHNLCVCPFQFQVLSRVTPMYLNVSTPSSYAVYISIKWFGVGLFIVRNKAKIFFSVFIINLYLHHLHKSYAVNLTVSTSVCRSEWLMNNAVSSAKSLIFSWSTAWYAMYNEKKERGPGTDPCGTPQDSPFLTHRKHRVCRIMS